MAVKNENEKNAVTVAPKFDLASLKNNPNLDKFKATNGQIKGLENIDKSDLKIGVFQLLQPLSKLVTSKQGEAGHFYNTLTKKSSESIDGILLTMVKSRVMWPAKFKSGDKPLCRSFDSIHGIGNPGPAYKGNIAKEGILCKKCPNKEWNNDKNEAPACRSGYNWLGLEATEEMRPFRYTAISSGVSPTKEFITDVTRLGHALFIYKVKISSVFVQDDKGAYYKPSYEIVDVLDSVEKMEEVERLLDSYKAIFLEDIDLDLQENLTMDSENLDDDKVIIIDGEDVQVEGDDDQPF